VLDKTSPFDLNTIVVRRGVLGTALGWSSSFNDVVVGGLLLGALS
jgi:hypothetical protein